MKAKTYGKQMPAGEAKPLGKQTERRSDAGQWHYLTSTGSYSAAGYPSRDAARAARRVARSMQEQPAENISATAEKVVDSATDGEVSLQQVESNSAIDAAAEKQQENPMTLTLKTLSKNGKQAYYTGSAQVLRFPLGAFPNRTAPQTIEVSGDVFVGPKEQKPKETKEERKARLAAMPKPTEAERIAQAEARLAKRKAKLAAANQL